MTAPEDIQERFRLGIEEEMQRRRQGSADPLTSSLGEFMMAQHADLVPMLRHPKLDWGHAAELFSKQGYRDGGGQPPTAETTRDIWLRVEGRRREGLKLRKSAR